MTTDLFTAAAVELVNEGVWEPDFKSMPITIHHNQNYYIDSMLNILRLRKVNGLPVLFCEIS